MTDTTVIPLLLTRNTHYKRHGISLFHTHTHDEVSSSPHNDEVSSLPHDDEVSSLPDNYTVPDSATVSNDYHNDEVSSSPHNDEVSSLPHNDEVSSFSVCSGAVIVAPADNAVPINQSGTEKGGGDSAREMMVVLGSGGHTSEMLTILEALLNDKRSKRISTLHLVVAETDQGSVARAKKLLEGRQLEVEWHMIPRSREVGQRTRKIAEEYKRFIVDYLSPHSATTVRQSSGLAWIESTQALSDAHEGFGMSVNTLLHNDLHYADIDLGMPVHSVEITTLSTTTVTLLEALALTPGTIRASDGWVGVADVGAALDRLTEHLGVYDLDGGISQWG
ncbi:hypothetical protein FOZ60_013521 [Perkinsus olseni]|uniref:UDP-N-acetylglucosamine transferase subunit ALG14 n=1 Tax=Perkinsus olseni TaxID=32597 RepID=A0A7J6P8G2_PEROL|nr:hypothetical protein FOZ60_013521 [Perkinsus olseni]